MTAWDTLRAASTAQEQIKSLKRELEGVKGETETEQEIRSEIDALREVYTEARDTIGAMQDSQHRMLLRYRYLERMPWKRIGREMHLSESSLFRLHRQAIKAYKIARERNAADNGSK